ncbi:UNVERIFIED_ORG: hypothetical protein GGE53_005166 [Rhizobium etli]
MARIVAPITGKIPRRPAQTEKLFLREIAKMVGGGDDCGAHVGICGRRGSLRENPELTFWPARQFAGRDKRCLDVEPSLQQDAWNADKPCGIPQYAVLQQGTVEKARSRLIGVAGYSAHKSTYLMVGTTCDRISACLRKPDLLPLADPLR